MYKLSVLSYILPILTALMLFVFFKTEKSKIFLIISTVISAGIIALSVTALIDSCFGIEQTETQVVFDETNSSNHSSRGVLIKALIRPVVVVNDANGNKYWAIGDFDRYLPYESGKTDVRLTYLPNTKLIIAVEEIHTHKPVDILTHGYAYENGINSKTEKNYVNFYHIDGKIGWICLLVIIFLIGGATQEPVSKSVKYSVKNKTDKYSK